MITALIIDPICWLLICYAIGIQYQRGGWCKPLGLLLIPGFLLDLVLNYTTLAVLTWDRPRKGEFTFSKRLYRLQSNTDWRGNVARPICLILNKIAPKVHIKAPNV